jgi:hypothetical protein
MSVYRASARARVRWLLALALCPAALAAGDREPMAEGLTEFAIERGDPVTPVPLAASSIVAYSSPNGLIASTGNLYWTSTSQDEFGPDVSTVWRASKGNVPGSEIALYSEYGDDRYFGAIVYANPGAFYGYFVANYQTPAGFVSQIKRVPLTGGAAVVIANSPAPIASRDLVTDGSTLFWVDAGGIRSVPVGGGPVTTIRASAFITRLRVDASYLYYGEQYLIFRRSKTSTADGVVASTSGYVTALHVDAGIGWLFWGEEGGGVLATTTQPQGPRVTYQVPSPGRNVTSVGWDGARVLWSDCQQPGNNGCTVKKRQGGITQVVTSNKVGVGNLQWDAARIFWGDAGFLRKYVH